MAIEASRSAAARQPAPLQRRLLAFAAAVLVPLVVGAVACGLLLLFSATRSQALAQEIVEESRVSVTLFQGLEQARIAGSAYMEDGDGDDLAEFRAAVVLVNRGLDSPVFDEADDQAQLRRIDRTWQAAMRQLRETPTGLASSSDDTEDPEDVFEEHVNASIGGVERLVASFQTETRQDLSAAERLNRAQALVALVALLVSLAVAGLLARRLAAGAVRPIHMLTQAARAFGSGHLGLRVEVTSSSAELQEMANTFNGMAEALQEQHRQLEQQAFTDSLTGIPNRALFEDRARHALARSVRTHEQIAVLMIDVDEFKLVNDGLGHSSGDRLIELCAQRISEAARTSDTVARLGGDEFAVLLESVDDLDDALRIAERIRSIFETPFVLNGSEVTVSVSIGISMAVGSLDSGELLRRADLAMYRVKEHGKNGAAFFDPVMEDRAVDRLDVLNALRKAVGRDELVAHYQPIVDLASGEIVAAEALMRWQRPGHGLIPPLDFIPFAEETGLIKPLGAWILKEACTQARGWREDGNPEVRVSVNVSARQLIDSDFEHIVSATLVETGLEPGALVLEVTESSVMQNPEVTIPKLDRIVRTGVQLSLDDFGEGYSSLSHLQRLPVHGLKIARPFVMGLADPLGDSRLVRGIIELATSLELQLVAEGIEEPKQREALLAFGCQLGQGFMFARPLELRAFRALLAEQHLPSRVA
jgi:diguanylate cyclase (GGDEF)-like protein